MHIYKLKIIETLVIVGIIFVLRYVAKLSTKKAKKNKNFQKDRVRFTFKLVTSFLYSAGVILILVVWGVSKGELALYLSSVLAVIGIALFAQWSMLSNITASVLLFLNHPAKIGDTIMILDKEFPLTGKIKDIGAFFLTFKTEEEEIVTIPNGLLFQKMVKIISHAD